MVLAAAHNLVRLFTFFLKKWIVGCLFSVKTAVIDISGGNWPAR